MGVEGHTLGPHQPEIPTNQNHESTINKQKNFMHSLEIYENEINDILNKNLNYSLLCFGGRQKHTIISWVLKLRGERKRAVQSIGEKVRLD